VKIFFRTLSILGIESTDNEDPFVIRRDLDRLCGARYEVRCRTSRFNVCGDPTSGSDFAIGDQTLCAAVATRLDGLDNTNQT
jgi:hypothetical protein